jgi:hypothetical protein
MKSLSLLLVTILCGATSFAQNEEDALRYSQNYFGGTARNQGSAGALSALGGDFSNASQNPAGLGRLTKSNFSITQNVEVNNMTSDFYGNAKKESYLQYNWSNISYVKAYELNPNKFNNWYAVQIGIGMNRIKSFNQDYAHQGQADSSILHSFINEAEGTPEDNIYSWHAFSAGLAYDTYAIDPGPNNTYTTDFDSGKAIHDRTTRRSGGITEFNVLTASGNYANKLMVGASFNYQRIKYSETFIHKETFTDDSLWIRSIDYQGQLDISGHGFNAKVGLIYTPVDQLRIGVAIETPTWIMMQDYWWNDMETDTDDGLRVVDPLNKPTGSYKYNIRTPFKANISIAGIIKKYGSIGAEVEFVDYSHAKLSDKALSQAPYSFNDENAQIENIYRSVLNLKIGAEARFTKQFYGRLGFANYGSPYKSTSGNNLSPTRFYTLGAGYNFGIVYLDAAYVLQTRNEDFYAYDPTINGSLANVSVNNSQIVFSIGARF